MQKVGHTARNQGDFAAAREFGEQALALVVSNDDPSFEALVESDVGMAD